jgi:hypothetical protein
MIFRGWLRNRIFELLCEFPYGLSGRELIDRVYADKPDGGPQWAEGSMHMAIMGLRKQLRRRYPLLHIERITGPRYQLVIRK